MHSSDPRRWVYEPHTEETTTVVLHGALAKRFGRRHQLGVRTAAEAAHALCALHPGFREAFQDGHYRVIRGTVAKGMPLSEGMLTMQIGRAGELHFLPAARGSKSGGIGKVILGAVIIIASIAAAVVTGGASVPLELGALGTVTVSLTSVAFFGASLLLSGISQMLSPQPKNNSTQADPKASFGLSGQTNSAEQGTPIPVVYGRQRVGSVIASFGYSAEDYTGLPPAGSAGTGAGQIGPFDTGAIGSGGGGKSGGAGGGAKEAPNTLRSNAIVRIIDVLSEGPIGGLVDGAKSIFFNGTPLQARDGTYNFQGVTWEVRLGYPDQAPVAGYPAAEQTFGADIGLPFLVKQQAPKTVTVNSATATAARVTIRLPTLLSQDPRTGDLKAGPNLDFYFEVRPTGGNWKRVISEEFAGQKCVSPYQRSYRFDLPGATDPSRATSWDIRLTRASPDDLTVNDHSELYFDAVGLITDHQLSYPNTAYVALTIDAAAFGSQLPSRAYEIDGIVCQVPLNYDPVARAYATSGPGTSMGTWDGASWKPAVTSNPAWCLYDMFSNNRYGMALPARVLAGSRYDLFPISQYADGMIPSGFKDGQGVDILEPRYALNVSMATQDDAYRVIQSMVSAFRGMSYWGAGRVVVSADMPAYPTAAINQANVIDGEFVYEGTSLKTRHTVVRVAWQDPANSYQTAIEVVEDFDAVVTLGQVPADVHAFGVTSRGLARRLGKWLLETEKHQNETVSCRTGMEHLRVRPGDVAFVSDPAFIGYSTGGRVGSFPSTTSIPLDRVIATTPEYTYTLSIVLPDGTLETRTVNSMQVVTGLNGGNSIALMTAPFSQAPDTNTSWIIQSVGPTGPHGPDGLRAVSARQFRIVAVAEPQRGTFAVTGINHDPNKYARVEYGLQFDATPYSVLGDLLATPLPPPTNVFARDYIAGVGTTTLVRTTVSCMPASDPRLTGVQFRAVGPEERYGASLGGNFDFDGLQLGTYVFGARSAGRDGRASVWVDSPPVLVDGLADAPDTVTGFTAQGGAMSVDLKWSRGLARDVLHYELWRAPAPGNGSHPFQFGGFTPVGTPAANGASLLATIDGTSFHDAGDVLGPDKAWAYWIRAINTTLVPGAFVGPVKALTTYYLTDNLQEAIRNTAVYAQALLGGAPTIVSNLQTPGTHEKQLVFNTTDQKLYTWDSTHQVWVAFIPLVPDSSGKLTADQIGAINQSSISGSLTAEQTQQLLAGIQAGTITSDKIASLVGDKVTGTLNNAAVLAGRVYDVDPVTGNSVVGVSTARLLGTVPGSQVKGNLLQATIGGGSIIDIDPATGNAVAGVSAARLLGPLDGTKLTTVPASLLRDVDPLTSQQVSGLMAARVAGQFVASQIAAGAVTAEKAAFGSPDNVIGNSCFTVSADGWNVGPHQVTPVIGTAYEVNYTPTPDGAARVVTTSIAPGDVADVYWTNGLSGTGIAYDAPIPCAPGECWEAQAAYLPQNGAVEVILIFARADGGLASAPTSGPATYVPPPNGKALSSWSTIGAKGVAPSGTVAVGLIIRFRNSGSVTSNLSAFITRAQLGRTVPNAVALLPWTPGGVTSIGGGQLRTNSVSARNVVANTLTGDKFVANAVTTRELSVGGGSNAIWNPSPQLSGEGWAGKGVGVGVNPASIVNPGWALTDGNATFGAALAAGATLDTFWTPETAYGHAVNPGEWWEAQAMLLPINATGYVFLQWLKADGTSAGVSQSAAPDTDYAGGQPGAGQQQTLSVYHLNYVLAQAPVLAASVRMGIRLWNNSGAAKTCAMFFARALLGLTVPGATQPSPFAPGGLTTVGNGVLKTDAVLARNIAAGQVTADKAAFGTSNNVVWNSCCTGSFDGWTLVNGATPGVLAATGDTDALHLAGYGSGLLSSAANIGAGSVDAVWWPQDGYKGVPCTPGQTWEAQARVVAAGCTGQLLISWYDAAGTPIGSSTGTNSSGATDTGQGARTLDKYVLLALIATAPAGSAFASLTVRMLNGLAAGQFLVFSQALLAQTVPNASQISIWSPGGLTQVSGGAVRTNSLDARVIKANQIGTRELAVGNSSNIVSNSCCAVTAEGWSYTAGGGAIASNLGSCASIRTSYQTPDGCGTIDTSLPVGGYVDLAWAPVSCAPGETYEAQMLVLPVASQASLYLAFQRTDGTVVGYSAPSNLVPQQTAPAAALQGGLAPFLPVSLIAQVPSSASKITMVLRLASPQPGQANGFCIFTRAGLGKTVPNATQVSPWAPGGITSIGGGLIKTETVVTRNLAAGAATLEKLAVASAANVIWNATCPSTATGWANLSTVASSLGSVTGDGMAAGSYALAGLGSGCVKAPSLPVGQAMFVAWDPDATNGVPCTAGDWWEASAYLAAHRCFARVRIDFVTAAGATVGAGAIGGRVAGPIGGSEIAQYGFSWCKGQVPDGAVRARMMIDGLNDNGADIPAGPAGSTPYVFFTKALLGPSTPVTIAQGAQPQPWQPGGVTQVSGGMLQTGAVVARTVSAGAIDGTKLSVGSPTNLIWNGCCTLSGSGWMSAVTASPPGNPYTLAGFGTGIVTVASLPAGQLLDVSWAPLNGADGSVYKFDGVHETYWGAAVPCTPGDLMEAQVKVNTHRCSVELFLLFVGVDGSANQVLISAPSTGAQSFAPSLTGNTLANYRQLFVRSAVPAGAVLCTLMMRMGNLPISQSVQGASSGSNPYLFFTQAGLGTYLPNVPAPMPWAPGGTTVVDGGMVRSQSIATNQLAVGAVQAGNIAAGQVTTGALAAGAVTAAKAAFGSPSNVIWNSCPDQGTQGWVFFTEGPNMPGVTDPTIRMGTAASLNPPYALAGFGSGWSQYVGSGTIYSVQHFVWDWHGNSVAPSFGVAVSAGKTYAAAALVSCGNNMVGQIVIIWFDAGGNVLPTSYGPTVMNNAVAGGAFAENQYTRLEMIAIAPANAVSGMLRILGYGNPNGGAFQPYMAWTKAMLGAVPQGAAVVGEWVPGGVTTIDGGMIKTGTLDANRINAGTVVAGSAFVQALTATTVTATSVKAILVGANRLTANEVDADTLTVGSVKAGAIGADQIAAGQLHASHLAADFALLNSAQIGVATIDTANIRNLVVPTGWIAPGAGSQLAVAFTGRFIGGSRTLYATVDTVAGASGVVVFLRAYFESDQYDTTQQNGGPEGGFGG